MKRLLVALLLLLPSIANATLIFDSPWNSISNGWSCVNRTQSGNFPDDHHAFVTDSGTPDPNTALRIEYPSGWQNGGEPYHCWNIFTEQEEIYVQYYFKYSSNYYFHTIDNKQTYYWIGSGSSGNFYLTVNGSRKINMVTQTYATDRHTSNTGYDPTIAANTWYKLTARFRMNTAGVLNGICQVWINDVLVINKSTIGYRSSSQAGQGFYQMTITPVFGGMSTLVKPATDYQWYDRTTVQTTAFGDTPAGDQNPPYTTTFTPADGATGVSQGTTSVSFHVLDAGDGVDITTLDVGGLGCASCGSCDAGLTCSGTAADYTITRTGLSLSYDEAWSEDINVSDLATSPNAMATKTYNFTVQSNPLPTLTVTTTTMSSGQVGSSYSATLSATGGTSPYTWDTSAGILPPGLSVPSSGSGAWGTPTLAGTYSFTLRVTDQNAATDTQAVSLTITPTTPGGGSQQDNNYADTYINSGSAGTNYGTSTELRVYQWPYATVANRTIVFDNADILAIPANKVISSATLRLYQTGYDGNGGSDPMRVYAYQITGTLPDTTTVTWTNFAGTLTQLGYTDVDLNNGFKEWDVTTAVAAAYAAQSPVYIALDGGSDGSQDANRIYASVDHATTAWRPQLAVVYTDPIVLTPPNPPTGGYVTAGNAQVTLYPGTSTGKVLFYSTYYTSDGTVPTKTNGTQLAGVTAAQVLSSLTNGTTYRFCFTASSVNGESVCGATINATPAAPADPPAAPAAPTGILVIALNGAVRLYPGSSPGATSYNCYRSDDGSPPTLSSTKITSATNGQIIRGLANGTYYIFACTAVNATGESALGAQAGVTPVSTGNINFLTNTGNFVGNISGSQLKNYLQ